MTPSKSVRSGTVITGLGVTELGKIYGRSASRFATDAVRRALADAGLGPVDVDGLLVSGGVSGIPSLANLQSQLSLRNLSVAAEVQGYGSSAIQMVELASRSILAGESSVVVCVWADAPLRPQQPSGSSYSR